MKSSHPITDYPLHASNFLSAIVFLLYGRLGPEQPDVRWTHAFLIGGVPALVHAAWLIRRADRNSIAIGVDLFLVIGAVLAPGSPTGSRLWGEELGPAAMLACVLVVGIVHTAWSDGGFVDGTFVDRARPALWRELADWRDERSVDGGNEPAARQD
ncbi:permease [Burkholderia arboris]|uniref:permease n=1 Tax=Burkholderia arboris TaxID=488730 RepID=UPI001FC7FADF|nr:permease [Burkholderia arboris]